MSDEISVAIDEVLEAIQKLTTAHDFLPEPGELSQTDGPAAGPSQQFRAELNASARQFSAATEAIRLELISMQQAVQHTTTVLLEQDDAVGTDIATTEAQLEAAAITTTPAAAPLTKTPQPATTAPGAANQIG